MTNETNDFEVISSSDEETIVSKDRFNELLLKLEQVLKELKRENEKENNKNSSEVDKKMDETSGNGDREEGFLNCHLKELEELKEISTSKSIGIEDIKWFFNSALFNLMNEVPECFIIEPIEIYECMLERIEITSKEKFHEHLAILLRKKTEEKNIFPFVRFFPILSAAKKRKNSFLDESFSPAATRVKLSYSP